MKTMEGSPNDIRGNGHRRTRIDVRPLATKNRWRDRRKKERHNKRAALGIYTTILIVLLWVTGSLRP